MKTFPAIVDSIKLALSNYAVVDDSKLDYEFIGDKVHDVRAILIQDEIREKKYADDLYYQRTECISVQVDANKSCETECVDTGINEVFVTLPALLTRVGWLNIKYFGLLDMSKNFTRKSLAGLLASKFSKWTKNDVVYSVISQDRAIIKNLICPIEKVTVIALFANPVDVCDYNVGEDMYPVPDPYKLEMIVKQDILSTYNIPRDEKNDARHSEEGFVTQRKK